MNKIIQMVKISEDNTLWIIDFNKETQELTFRTSETPKRKVVEKVIIKDDIIHTSQCFFHSGYIDKFLNENNDS